MVINFLPVTVTSILKLATSVRTPICGQITDHTLPALSYPKREMYVASVVKTRVLATPRTISQENSGHRTLTTQLNGVMSYDEEGLSNAKSEIKQMIRLQHIKLTFCIRVKLAMLSMFDVTGREERLTVG